MNTYIFSGNLGRDAEVRHTQGGTAVCSFTVAVKAGYGDNEKTEWVKCALFGKRAEGGLPQYLVKGQQVVIQGEPKAEAWSDKTSGEAKGALSVFVKELDLVGKASGGGKADPAQHASGNKAQQNPTYGGAPQPSQNGGQGGVAGPNNFDDFDDDIPFIEYQRGSIC